MGRRSRRKSIRKSRKSRRKSRKTSRKSRRRFGTHDRRTLDEYGGGQLYNVYYGPDNFLLADNAFENNSPLDRALSAE